MESIHALDDDNFESKLNEPGVMLVDFWAPWCGPCRIVAPIVETIARKYQGRARVAKVNVDESPLLASRYGIRGIPTLAIFKDGEMVDQIVGAAPQEMLEAHLDEVLAAPEATAP